VERAIHMRLDSLVMRFNAGVQGFLTTCDGTMTIYISLISELWGCKTSKIKCDFI